MAYDAHARGRQIVPALVEIRYRRDLNWTAAQRNSAPLLGEILMMNKRSCGYHVRISVIAIEFFSGSEMIILVHCVAILLKEFDQFCCGRLLNMENNFVDSQPEDFCYDSGKGNTCLLRGFPVAIFWTVEHSQTDSNKLCAIGNK
ncbi:hypothetical protein SADUNF_Sadunf03G0110900 [Salix dunnii]|uniref:Uncharacterized protein n=1 Tax=Salix dunnii TaxID=1413687 RepID=A0A835KHT5_9ROSI|nr:hypothetical protein SADUNF_Sadunf03G0110900 [Salix dunnii]